MKSKHSKDCPKLRSRPIEEKKRQRRPQKHQSPRRVCIDKEIGPIGGYQNEIAVFAFQKKGTASEKRNNRKECRQGEHLNDGCSKAS
ncbi:MAG: hypothetical protein NZ651_06390, partial [Candidatus Bipolaricaulota bacterium]|nr:hypothetical protein [Candidatus Bipolaricaulota bacterium]MDW8127383.1 hypothetical protein [Candidatus Bipolaricaulota bacterium]